jgi:DnaJ-class molecular chaperone
MSAGKERVECPSCGGAGGGPFGRAGSAWDTEDYVCPRCKGVGMILVASDVASHRPGIVKAASTAAEQAARKRKAAG